jgi:hypothetical protein
MKKGDNTLRITLPKTNTINKKPVIPALLIKYSNLITAYSKQAGIIFTILISASLPERLNGIVFIIGITIQIAYYQ